MKKTVCELFAGVGGFRCGLNGIKTLEDIKKPEKWETTWFSQWEPAEKSTQYAHDCYVLHFGTCLDSNGEDTTNMNIEEVESPAKEIVNSNLEDSEYDEDDEFDDEDDEFEDDEDDFDEDFDDEDFDEGADI